MALTSWTPTGALSKITQFSMGAIDSTNPASNLIPAGMTAEVASNASICCPISNRATCWARNRVSRQLAT
jgi:hypothetical protein